MAWYTCLVDNSYDGVRGYRKGVDYDLPTDPGALFSLVADPSSVLNDDSEHHAQTDLNKVMHVYDKMEYEETVGFKQPIAVDGVLEADAVSIGAGDDPDCQLHIKTETGTVCAKLESEDSDAGIMQVQLYNDDDKELSIGKLGSNVNFFGVGSGAILNRDGNLNIVADSNDPIRFMTDATDAQALQATEKARITGKGELQVGVDIAGGNYAEIDEGGHHRLYGGAIQWTDLRVSVNDTQANGSNPPSDALFKNDGNEVPGDAYALSFLSTTQGILTVPDNVNFDTSADFVFEFWCRPQVGTQNNIELVRKQSVFEIDFVGTDQLNLNVIGVGASTGSVAFNRGAWNHVLVKHDTTAGTVEMYLNNQLNISINGACADNANDFVFNRRTTLYDVDYVAYWDDALTVSQISTRYNSGAGTQLAGNETGLKGLWELNDGTGTTVDEKTGLASDGTISGGSEGTQWDWVGGHVGNTSSGSRGVILKFFSPDTTSEVYFTVQVPHEYKLGSDFKPHVHFSSLVGGTSNAMPRWGLEYTISNINSVFGDTATIYSSQQIDNAGTPIDITAYKHHYAQFPDIDGSAITGVSSQLICRLFRDAEDAADTFTDFVGLIEFDLHYQVDSFGSNQESTKD